MTFAPPAGRYNIVRRPASHRTCRLKSGVGVSMSVAYQDFITIEPGKRGGKPCIRGMRITVYDVLSYLAAGMSRDEILADFPYLTGDDIQACLGYAADRERHAFVMQV